MVLVLLLWGVVRGRESRASLTDRMVWSRRHDHNKPHIWIHGASVGELTAARHLIETIITKSGYPMVVTANTKTGVTTAQNWGLAGVSVRHAPADAFGAAARFLRQWNVAAQITLENELWPNRIRACDRAGVPVFGVGTRPPSGSASGGIVARIAANVLRSYQQIWPLHETARAEILTLAASAHVAQCYNAKATRPTASPTPGDAQLLTAWQGMDVVLAASTHAPEESLMAQAFKQAVVANPRLRMIIAPRHPDRGPALARSLENYGIPMACRSEGEAVSAETQLYLADTIGEMDQWYAQAPRTIIGGTFAPKGGHTPIEPIRAGSLPLHGPDVSNHQDSFQALDAADGAVLLPDQKALVAELSRPADGPSIARKVALATAVVDNLAQTAKATSKEIAEQVLKTLNS